jgi:hypothetical protein
LYASQRDNIRSKHHNRKSGLIGYSMAQMLYNLVRAELAQPVDPRVIRLAAAIAAHHGTAARAVLFYGSCLRTSNLDGHMLDFYLIVSDYRTAYDKSWLAGVNRLIPPNVFPFELDGLVAKYAVLSEADFNRLNRSETVSVSVWARFAQPSRLVWQASREAAEACIHSITEAAPTLLAAARPMFAGTDPLELWRKAFALTYSAELRAERSGQAISVVDACPDRYLQFTGPALAAAGLGKIDRAGKLLLAQVTKVERRQTARIWAKRRRIGKLLSVLRLAKASATFAGGIDYLAWKINRHAGTDIAIAPWQRRWPLVGAIVLLPYLLRRRAIR